MKTLRYKNTCSRYVLTHVWYTHTHTHKYTKMLTIGDCYFIYMYFYFTGVLQ